MNSAEEWPRSATYFLGNHVVNHTKGPAPAFAFSYGLDLRLGDPDHVARSGHTPETTHGGCVLEFTNIGGLIPSPITGQGQDFHLGSQRPMAHGELTRGMACGGHILLENHEIA